ncbi:oxygen-independent coproporphyrinogen iii oxidase [Leptolyngbya sp. Heron Island J]|uniref:oxygen-independent coproporphyrinogen III oxidase n=1 Tax=Leptolyngbya sp. Heron Island J TaxID=1385935 RepID=UPI0003B977BA|nr:oxygen-independent coproporphyrinogen III oxidase [Leptolyngbya sp. Heron Island J]ESA38192.1 oxygen-independent coproporphyrinogen iii oxidase [Leptolyngbya sp. Heron Island J]
MKSLLQTVEFNADLIQKYNQPLPRYTSYPPATELTENFDARSVDAAFATGNYQKTPLSLYCHIPFCQSACYFCGCNTIVTQNAAATHAYLDALICNIEQVAARTDANRVVNQLHWGGGTPNYLTLEQVKLLWQVLHQHFSFAQDAEISIEVNPVSLSRDYVLGLRELGFNRISFGIQDFNPQVQAAINRLQPEEVLFQVMDWMREAAFDSVNVDLIYGLPYQTLATFSDTITKTLSLDPDRIAVFNFAYLPHMLPVQQKHIDPATLPSPSEKLDILHMTIDQLTHRGYQFIGMDHFAKPDDELTIAQQTGQLHRNFQGYTTQPESDLLAFGMTAISMFQNVYTQNHKQLKGFYDAIAPGGQVSTHQLPIERGVALSQDDILRRAVIMELMCQFELSKGAIEEKYHLNFEQDFDTYFARERRDLETLAADGLVRLTPNHIEVTPAGRLLVRNIAAVFDTYLRDRKIRQFSQSV